MTGLVSRFWALSRFERGLLIEAMLALGIASLSVALFPFRKIASVSARHSGAPTAGADRGALVRQIGWAVAACARRVPWRAKCFEQGLAAQWMLGRRNLPATLLYGIAKGSDRRLIAHVWVRSGMLDVIGCENSGDFTELARFPPRA